MNTYTIAMYIYTYILHTIQTKNKIKFHPLFRHEVGPNFEREMTSLAPLYRPYIGSYIVVPITGFSVGQNSKKNKTPDFLQSGVFFGLY